MNITLSYGDRVRERGVSDNWNKDMVDLVPRLATAIREYALPQLSRLDSLMSLVEEAEKYPDDVRNNQGKAYMLAREGCTEESLKCLDKMIIQHDITIRWQVDVAIQAKALLNLLVESPSEARKQLETWEVETAKNIGFSDFRD